MTRALSRVALRTTLPFDNQSLTSTLASPGPGFQPNGPPSIPRLQHSARRAHGPGRARPDNFGGEVGARPGASERDITPAPLGPHRGGATVTMARHNPPIKALQIFRPRWLRASMPQDLILVQRVSEPV